MEEGIEKKDASFLKNLDTGEVPAFVRVPVAGPPVAGPKKNKRRTARSVSTKCNTASSPPVLSQEKGEQIDRELQKIYGNSDGSMPTMTRFDSQKGRGVLGGIVLLTLSLVLLGAVVWAGLFFFGPKSNFSEQDVLVSVSVEGEVEHGKEIRYRISYRNAQDIVLRAVRVEAHYPDGFLWKEVKPASTDPDGRTWQLGDLAAGESGEIEIVGIMTGDIGSAQSLRVFFNYTPENFHSQFQAVATAETSIASSPVSVDVSFPNQLASGSAGTLQIVLRKAEGEAEQTGLRLRVSGGDGFVLSNATSTTKRDGFYEIAVPTLTAEPQSFSLAGSFSSASDGKGRLAVSVVTGSPDRTVVLARQEQDVVLVQQPVSVRLTVNGSHSSISVQPGEMLHANITVINQGTEDLVNSKVRLVISAPSANNKSILDWQALDDPHDGTVVGTQESPDVRRGTIEWNKGQWPSLTKIEARKELGLDVAIPVKDGLKTDLSDFPSGPMTLMAAVVLESSEGEVISSNPMTVIINSDTSLAVESEMRRRDDVNAYSVKWIVRNTFHEIKDLRVEADLFGDAAWDPNELVSGAGSAVFVTSSKKIVWTVPNMPTSLDVIALQFGILQHSVNPSQTQLLSKARLTAVDVVTGETLTIVGDSIDLVSQ